jgi:hypothetical protein
MNCEELLAAYFDAMKTGSSCKKMPNGRLSIVMPFLYPDHDNVEIFVRDKTDSVVVSDLGETMRRLDTIGMDVQASGTFAYQADRIASGFQVGIKKGILFKEGSPQEIGSLVFDVVSACMAIGGLAYRGRGYLPLTFAEEVTKLLKVNDFDFEEKHPLLGNTGTRYHADFKVMSHNGNRVSYVHTLAARTPGGTSKWVDHTYRMWRDIITSGTVVRKVSLISDDGTKVKEEDIKLLQTESDVLRWSDQQGFVAFLQSA